MPNLPTYSLHRGVNRYANVAFTTLARIYSSICTNLHQIYAEQIWCKSNFSSTGRKLEISSNKTIAKKLILIVLNAINKMAWSRAV